MRSVNKGAFAAGLALLAVSAMPMEVPPTEWPLERLIANLEKRLGEEPDDAEAHYNLGRTHAFAFALETSSLLGGDSWLKNLEDQRHYVPTWPLTPPPTPAEQLTHLTEGVKHLKRADELEDVPFRHLTLGWLLETGAHLASRVDTVALLAPRTEKPSASELYELSTWIDELGSNDEARSAAVRQKLLAPDKLEAALPLLQQRICTSNARRHAAVSFLLERYWIERAITEYWRCFEVEMQSELASEELSVELGKGIEGLIVYEALSSYRRLVKARGIRAPEEEKRLADAEEKWKQLEAKPRSSWVTPLLVAVDGRKSLDELIAPSLEVPFDLDGDFVTELWPWIAPGTGWLVWDPERLGEITSGRQLFGTASAWLFFEDGYRVLDAFDDDRDGELRGGELAGISVWFDRDTDGVSDRGEVVPVEELGIVALGTQATMKVGASPANPCGVEMSDGRVLPTYDWVLAPVGMP